MSALLEVKNLKVHFPVKHGMFSRVRVKTGFGELTLFQPAFNFPQ
jgi:ABC-type oligopeptide transport system ATPase subunit